MEIRKILAIIFFFMTVLIVIQLAPDVQTANTAAYNTWGAASENASFIGLGTIMPFGDVLIIISIMIAAGLLSMKIASKVNVLEILAPVGLVIAVIIALNFFDSMITSLNTLISGSSGFGQIFYGMLGLMIYLLIIVLPNSYYGYQKAREFIGGKKGKKGGTTEVAHL